MQLNQTETKPLMVLVGSGYHLYREYLLTLVGRAADVWLFTTAEPKWEHPYIVGHTVVDTLDADAMIAAAAQIQQRDVLAGVLCWDEVRMPQAARLAEVLGLPGGDPAAIMRCRDKHQTRLALDRAGVPQARSRLVSDLVEARAVAAEIGYPLILKPRALGASFGVSKVERPQDFDECFANARSAFEDGVPFYESGVLVETYLDGPEISVDSAIVDGVVTPLFIARKVTGFDPHFEEIEHSVDAGDPLLQDPALLTVLRAAHRALGFHTGITHAELRLCADGPHVIEVNCRLGGDMIPRLGYLATGIDPGAVAVQVACGLPVQVSHSAPKVAAIRFYYADAAELVVDRVDIDDNALRSEIVAATALAQPGQKVQLPPEGHVTGRIAYAIAVADDAARCAEALEHAAGAIRVTALEEVA